MEQIRENVFNYFGVSQGVLQNSAKNEDLEAFFDGAIENAKKIALYSAVVEFFKLLLKINSKSVYI